MFQKNKTTLLLICVIVIFFGLVVFARYVYENIAKISFAIKQAEAQIMLLEKKEKAFSKMTAEIQSSKENAEKIEAVFLKEETFVNFVELLESISREAGTVLTTESAILSQASETADVLVSLEGNFSQIIKFFILLDHLPISGIVKHLEIIPKQTRAGLAGSPDVLISKAAYTIFNFR